MCRRLMGFSVLLIMLVLAGCASSLSPDTYTTRTAGSIHRVVKGRIVSARVVQVSDDWNSGDGGATGTLAGAALGALAGSQIGHGTGSAAAAIGGAVAGGVLGNATQKGFTGQVGVEYVIKLRNGSMISVVQGPRPTLNRGQHVLIEYGYGRARVIPDPDYAG
jgi:outer membrane lipoprotein SlyB